MLVSGWYTVRELTENCTNRIQHSTYSFHPITQALEPAFLLEEASASGLSSLEHFCLQWFFHFVLVGLIILLSQEKLLQLLGTTHATELSVTRPGFLAK